MGCNETTFDDRTRCAIGAREREQPDLPRRNRVCKESTGVRHRVVGNPRFIADGLGRPGAGRRPFVHGVVSLPENRLSVTRPDRSGVAALIEGEAGWHSTRHVQEPDVPISRSIDDFHRDTLPVRRETRVSVRPCLTHITQRLPASVEPAKPAHRRLHCRPVHQDAGLGCRECRNTRLGELIDTFGDGQWFSRGFHAVQIEWLRHQHAVASEDDISLFHEHDVRARGHDSPCIVRIERLDVDAVGLGIGAANVIEKPLAVRQEMREGMDLFHAEFVCTMDRRRLWLAAGRSDSPDRSREV